MTETTPQEWHNTIHPGRFVERTDRGFLFDVGEAGKAIVALEEFPKEAPDTETDHDVLLERRSGDLWLSSVRKAEKLRAWDALHDMAESNAIIPGTFLKEIKGGMAVDVGLRAFNPRSHIDLHRVRDLTPYIGRQADFQVLEFDEDRCQLVVSRRKVLESTQQQARADILDRLTPGEQFDGVVRSLQPYGAFVDIGGGVEGLLHVSNMSWGRIDHPSELLRPGDEVRVVLLKYDPDKKRISLSRKQLLEDPWTHASLSAGDVVSGAVVSLADFGAFIKIQDGLEGLVHVTELSWTERVAHPSDVLTMGQNVSAKILSVDTDARRLSLSIKKLLNNPWETFAKDHNPGDRLTGPIRNITEFGLFIELAAGVEGLVHVSNLSWSDTNIDPSQKHKVGDDLEVVILGIDLEQERLELGVKQLSENPWDLAEAIARPGKKIETTITRIAPFGAFVEVVPGVEGLIHISELSIDRVDDVARVVRPGQTVEALVLSFDKDSQRLSMSLKRDELDEEVMTSYSDEEMTTNALGDLLREKLGVSGEEE